MFVDTAKVFVQAGRGGNGAVRRGGAEPPFLLRQSDESHNNAGDNDDT